MKRTKYTGVTAAVTIPSAQPSRRLHIYEDGSAAAQGLTLTFPDDNFTTAIDAIGTTAEQPYVLTDQSAAGNNKGHVLGLPVQVYRPADNYCKVASKTGTGANFIVEEYE